MLTARLEPQGTTAKSQPIEWPTIGLAALIYGGWAVLIFYHSYLPAIFTIVCGAWLVAWQSSLQHELLHGHPTPSQAVNKVLAFTPLSLWLPYEIYRTSHLDHHRASVLTAPQEDPESYYWSAARFARLGPAARLLAKAQMTFIGRLVLGPASIIGRFLSHELAMVRENPRGRITIWFTHLIGCTAVLIWVVAVSKMSLWFYIFGIVYPGTSLTLIRSFAEHRASEDADERTAIVENAGILGLLFLFNNLHVVHHLHPELPWYRIPQWYRAHRTALIAPEATRVYDGYFAIARRYLFAPFDDPVHPLGHEREVISPS